MDRKKSDDRKLDPQHEGRRHALTGAAKASRAREQKARQRRTPTPTLAWRQPQKDEE